MSVQNSHAGVYNPNSDGNLKIRNYYEMLEKNRRNEKMQNDLTKIYMVNGLPSNDSSAGSPILASSGSNQQYYSRKQSMGQGPSGHDGSNHGLLPNGNHFHNRNQSLDVVNSNKLKNKVININARKRAAGGNYLNSINQEGGEASEDNKMRVGGSVNDFN